MHVKQMFSLLIGVYIFNFLFSCQICSGLNTIDSKALDVGEEIWRETLPLQSSSHLYHLRGLKPYTWYEVKISYPASIPASFSLELMRGQTEMDLRMNRRLLNTEKIIFKTENLDHTNQDDGMYVLVSVEPDGFVAMPNVKERIFIIYNSGTAIIFAMSYFWGFHIKHGRNVGNTLFGFGISNPIFPSTVFTAERPELRTGYLGFSEGS